MRVLSLCLLLSACHPTPIDTATAVAVAGRVEVNRSTAEVEAQIDAEMKPRLATCGVDKACFAAAKAATYDALGARIKLSLQAVAAQHRAADAVTAVRACTTDTCRSVQIAAIGLAEADLASLLVQLRRTPPLPGASAAPATSSAPVAMPPAPVAAPATSSSAPIALPAPNLSVTP